MSRVSSIVIYPDASSHGLVMERLLAKQRFLIDDTGESEGSADKEGRPNSIEFGEQLERTEPWDEWADYGWSDAFLYFAAIRDYPYVDYARPAGRQDDAARMEQYARLSPPPPASKLDYVTTTDPSAGLELPPPEPLTTSVADALRERTIFPTKLVSLSELANALYYTYGKIGTVDLPGQGQFILRTSPSGGARHSIEAYIIPIANKVIPGGAYHYDFHNHRLVAIQAQPDPQSLLSHIYDSRTVAHQPQFIVVMTSVVERSMWRYREPRTYRVVLHDLGHLAETATLVWNSIGPSVLCCYGFNDDTVSASIGVDPISEPVLGCLLVY